MSFSKEYANIPTQLLAREQVLKVEITVLEQKLADLANPEEEALFRQELQSTQKNYQSFIDSLEQEFQRRYKGLSLSCLSLKMSRKISKPKPCN